MREGQGSSVNPQRVFREMEQGVAFNESLDLYESVKVNEDFFLGRQWEGVKANGLPTPVFNFIKRVVLYLVASISTDNVKAAASPLPNTGRGDTAAVEKVCRVVNAQLDALFEQNKLGKSVREFVRNAAVDGDGCIYTWFDPDAETGQSAKGAIRMEVLENTRVLFGNPNRSDVEGQPFLLIMRREDVEEVRERFARAGGDPDRIQPDDDPGGDRFDLLAGDRVTVVTRLWKDRETGTVHAVECVRDQVVRPRWDTGLKRYPIVWMPWDFVHNCYHGQSAVTGLIPNQIFVNKAFAMSMISLMTTAYPKIVYDKTRIDRWSNTVGQAIGVNGGDVNGVAKAIEPAAISPQVSQFIQSAISYTKEFMGATDTALGNVRPDNTSAIIALQKASAVPLEIVRQNLWQCVEDLAAIWMDVMRACYGKRWVEVPAADGAGKDFVLFDFAALGDLPLAIRLDVGASAYWSEIAQMNTLDNLLTQGKIDVVDYLERVPAGYIVGQRELIEKWKERVSEHG